MDTLTSTNQIQRHNWPMRIQETSDELITTYLSDKEMKIVS